MSENKELFELCKQVYEATGWGLPYDGKNDLFVYRQDGTSSHKITSSMNWGEKIVCPLYTSDYLLDKLPVYSEDAEGMLSVTTRQGQERNGWMAYYEDIDGYSVDAEGIGKSPLEAILRLTLKLHEEEIL